LCDELDALTKTAVVNMVDKVALGRVVHEYLSSFDELSNVKTKDVRVYVQSKLGLPVDYFSGERKEELVKLITSYHTSKSASSNATTSRSNVDYKEGRFSKEESSMVQHAAEIYAAEKGVQVEELCGAKGKGGERHRELWNELAQLLPHRKRDVSRTSALQFCPFTAPRDDPLLTSFSSLPGNLAPRQAAVHKARRGNQHLHGAREAATGTACKGTQTARFCSILNDLLNKPLFPRHRLRSTAGTSP
jgi:hypothetical protein